MSQRDNASFRPPEPLGRSPNSYITRAYAQMYLDETTGKVHYEGVVDGWAVNVKTEFGAKGTGITDDLAPINAAIASLGGSGDLFFPKGTYLISDDLTQPAGVQFVQEAGAIIKISDNKTLTLNGKLNDTLFQKFEYVGAGSAVVFGAGSVKEVPPHGTVTGLQAVLDDAPT